MAYNTNEARTSVAPVTSVHQISINSFTEDNKTLTRSVIGKKMSNYSNIFYYMKTIVQVLEDKLGDLKRYNNVSADEYDLMFVLVKRIREAVIDAYNEYTRIRKETGKVHV